MICKVITLKNTSKKRINIYKNNLIEENKIIITSDSFHVFAIVMLPYLTFTKAKAKIKLLSYFFPNSHG